MDGESLRDRLQRERQLPVEEAVHITKEVADALQAAHTRGVVHRDVKPENILLQDGHAIVADFGIARAVDAAGGEKLTKTGIAVGTPAYMSPEQGAGETHLDGRSDIYALGCVLYEMLAGEPPYTGPTPGAILAKKAVEPLPSLRTVRETVSPELEQVTAKALAKTPADRFATGEEFAQALLKAPLTARPGSGVPPFLHSWRLAMLGAGATGLIVLGAIGITRLGPTAGTGLAPDRVVVAAFENGTGDSTLNDLGNMAAHWITQGLQASGLIGVVPTDAALEAAEYVRTRAAEGGREGREDPVQALARETGAAKVVSGDYYAAGGQILFQVDVTDARERQLLGSLGPIAAPLDSPMVAIESVREQVTGLLAVELDERLASRTVPMETRPPKLEACARSTAASSTGWWETIERRSTTTIGRSNSTPPSSSRSSKPSPFSMAASGGPRPATRWSGTCAPGGTS